MREYAHLELGKDAEFFSGYYTLLEEGKLSYQGREVLYVMGQARVEAGCRAPASLAFVNVPGYVVAWQARTDAAGHPVSVVEPVADEGERKAIASILRERLPILQVEFM